MRINDVCARVTLARLRCVFIVGVLLGVCGCASRRPELSLAHAIQIPQEYSAGSEEAAFPDMGVAERYVSAYDRGWWIAVQRYAEDINYADPAPLVMSGWAEEAQGGWAGYCAAREQLDELIQVYGKQKVSAYLQQFRLPDEK